MGQSKTVCRREGSHPWGFGVSSGLMLSRRPAVDLRDRLGSATQPSLPRGWNSVTVRQGDTGMSSQVHKRGSATGGFW